MLFDPPEVDEDFLTTYFHWRFIRLEKHCDLKTGSV